MSEIVEYLGDDQLKIGVVTASDKKRLTVSDERGRATKLAPDKILFRHSGDLATIRSQIERMQADVDVSLLWEAIAAEDVGAAEASALAELFFDQSDALHSSAIFRALVSDRLHFRRRGKSFEPRSADEIEQLLQQRAAESRAEAEQTQLREALSRPSTIDDALAERLVASVRGKGDRALSEVLAQRPFADRGREEPVRAFSLLLDSGRLSATADIEVVAAGLTHDHSAVAREQAAVVAAAPAPGAQLRRAAFTIDDATTREVDDALTVSTDDELLRVDIDIADVARFVARDDALDREAQRRASSVYLPTATYYMLPEVVSADRASLHAGERRPAVRTSVWLAANGEVARFELSRSWIVVERRLDYESADALISSDSADEVAEALRRLRDLAAKLRSLRAEAGALFVTRREWKLQVSEDGQQITVKQLQADSPSRQLVAELMILANRLGAEYAIHNDVPLIYRVQSAPTEPLPAVDPDDPALFLRLRGLIAPAKLSLHAGPHWGLGLEAYTQVTSPLRRYSDMVLQRQIAAAVEGEQPPYAAEDLLTVLANVEGVDQEMKRLEAAVTQRWALEHVARGERKRLPAMIIAETQTGYRAQLIDCGATGLLQGKKNLDLGAIVEVDVAEIRPRRGALKMRLSQ